MHKRAAMSEAISRGFLTRGFDELTSMLAAQLCVSVFNITLSCWLDQDSERPQPLSELVQETLRVLQSITQAGTHSGSVQQSSKYKTQHLIESGHRV